MGSINLGNLLLNMHIGSVSDPNAVSNSGKPSSSNNEFGKMLDKAKQKETNNKSSINGNNKTPVKKASKSNQIKDVNLEELEEMEEVTDEVTSAILEVLSMQLQVPVEEMTTTLDELGLSPIDLLDENNFSQFIMDYYGEGSTTNLLMDNTNVKDISKLFTKLQEVSTQVVGDELHKVIEQTTLKDEVVIDKAQMAITEEVRTHALEEGAHLEETVNSIWKPKEEKTVAANETMITGGEYTVTLSPEHLGLTVPVQAFESTIKLTNDQIQTNQNTGGVHVKPELNLTSQIVDHIEVTKLEQMQEIKMQLSPKELGQLTIKMVEKNGMLVAEIKVESEKTKEFILNEIGALKESLSEQGIEVSNVQVDVRQNDQTTQMQQQRQKSSRRIQEIIAKHLQELEEEEVQMSQVEKLDIGESEIDYMI